MQKNLKLLVLLAVAVSVSVVNVSAQQVVKWVDENGRVHYGDKVPEQYEAAAEVIETDISVISPEAEVRDANQQHVQQLRQDDAWEENAETREERERQRAEAKRQRELSRSKPLTREECRNIHVNRVARRTECFKRADEYEQENHQ